MVFAWVLAIPLAYFATLVILLFKRDARGIGYSLLFFAAFIITGAWGIKQSRASTAGIGFLFLPLAASIAGFFGLAFGRWQRSDDLPRKLFAWLALACAIVTIVLNIAEGQKTIAKNRVRDDQQEAFTAEIAHDRDQIAAALTANPGRERIWLDSAIRARFNDRAFLLAALPSDSISPDILDSLARSNDLGVTLEALRNPNTRPATLERVYRTASYPDYFFQAIAAHRNTPPGVLRELYARPGTISGLDIWFAGNPSSPKEILINIGRTTTNSSVVAALMENPSADCATMSALAENLMKKQNRDADNTNVKRFSEVYPTVCKKASEE